VVVFPGQGFRGRAEAQLQPQRRQPLDAA